MKVTQKLLVPAVMALLGTACGANNMAYQPMPANYYNNPAYTGANSAYPGGTGTPMNPYPDMTGLDSNLPTGTLMGKVVDSLNKAGLGSVRVQVVGVNPPLMTTTDASGNFTLSNVPQGRQVLTVQRNDYTNVNGNNNITAEVKAGTTVALPQAIELVPFRASAVNGFIRAFNNFKQPRGIALATATNNIYVVDVVGAGGLSNYDHGEIKKLSADGGIIDAFGAPFSGNRLFSTDMFRLLKRPNGIAVDSGGNVFVANTGHNLVRRYGPAGQWLSNIEADFQELYDVAVQSTGDVIVSDPGSGALMLLDSSLNVRIPNLMRMPANGLRGITTTNNDDILVVNASAPAGQVIMKFDRYGNRLPLAFGRIGGVQPASFSNPTDIAVDNRNGDIYVVDSGNNRVQRFDSEGNYLSEFGSFGTQNGQFNAPWGIAIDNEGFVYVSDTKNMRVQKFAPGRSINQPTLGAAVPFS